MGLVSCEKEALNGEATIHFTLSDSAYGSDEVRSTGHMRMEPETVVVPVEGDLHAYATLEEDTESPLRAPGDATLDVGTRVLIVVYDNSDAYMNSCEYEVTTTGGAIEPVGATTGLTLTTGNYKFVAYSFNTTSVPGYAASITDGAPYSPNGNASDPLWGISGPHSITAGGTYNISIAMKHQFSRVALKATTDGMDAPVPTISDMEAVLLGYKASEVTALTGALTKGAAEEQTITFPTFSAATTVTSDACMVYAGGESTTSIKITSATIGGTTRTGLVARFGKQLEPGKSYTLRVSFKKLRWARSNIYWDSQKLTFVPAGTDKSKEMYQGVFFKWGSLVGISPGPRFNGNFGYINVSVPLYMPVVKDDLSTSTWIATTSTAVMADVNAAYTAYRGTPTTVLNNNYTTWNLITEAVLATDIPCLDPSYVATDVSRSNTYAIDEARNTMEMYQSFRGDICQYISKTQTALKGYRLPTAYEYSSLDTNDNIINMNGWNVGGPFTDMSLNLADTTGTTVLTSYAKNTNIDDLILPVSGNRSNLARGQISTVLNRYVYYWTGGSGAGSISARTFYATNDRISISGSDRFWGFPVRCVHN
jgi:hypothetical protein